MSTPKPIKSDEVIAKSLLTDPRVSNFVKQAEALLKETNRPNVITLDEFLPFVPMFNMDKERYEKDKSYQIDMHRLYNRWRFDLGINLYEVTFVIRSKEDQTVVHFLNRMFTRIKGDDLDDPSKSMREKIPSAVPRSAADSREQLLLNATMTDIANANNTPEMHRYFRTIKMQSAIMVTNATRAKMGDTVPVATDTNPVIKEEEYDSSNTYLDD